MLLVALINFQPIHLSELAALTPPIIRRHKTVHTGVQMSTVCLNIVVELMAYDSRYGGHECVRGCSPERNLHARLDP